MSDPDERASHAAIGANDGIGPSFWAVIPAGGAGTRLWPLSRAARPKFLLPLIGERSLLQQTTDRLGRLAPSSQTLVVCGPAHAVAVARQLPDIPEANLIIEPAPKGSGPAIGLAAALIARQDPTAVMGSFAADHDVRDEVAFQGAVKVAIQAAQNDHLVTIGLAPSRPETGFGYIERTDEVVLDSPEGQAFRSASFHEKPDSATATAYVESGRFLWNASMFVWRVTALLEEMARLQPELHEGISQIADAWGLPEQERVTADVWTQLSESTIDQGVMERATNVVVVPAAMGWSDIGDWHGLGELLDAVPGVTISSDVVEIEAHRNVVWSETGRLVALVGVNGIVVVDAPDALLIASRERAQDVRRVVNQLRDDGRLELT